ncbi:SRPBCC domain-containing protein [Streptomyces thermoviolaceus]|uniref:Carbon monoxide dehydrogenase subunit G n=1 Tax=Streptomyces thermoviolaceus subsp. thermoviolaceus TaxID=66860 RepID=A0ABX0YYC3_STRTL|nr:SRPBCC domain-containing protein [Streptomyces thermoviolaceus]NJP16073.1 hypothetical protein [Streptomyces thermoviolaceus subsp. thermoviolaceus]
MEHEVFVPVPAQRLRAALADPVQVARAVPGFQQEEDAEPVTGRLRLRIGGTSITYRGTLRLTGRDDGDVHAEGEAAEARGTGTVKLALRLSVRGTDGGSVLAVDGTVSAGGRITELDSEVVRAAVLRLLNRFADHLGTGADRSHDSGGTAQCPATEDVAPLATGDFEAGPDADDAPVPPQADATDAKASAQSASEQPSAEEPSSEEQSSEQPSSEEPSSGGSDGSYETAEPGAADTGRPEAADTAEPGRAGTSETTEHVSVFDTEIPPSSLDPLADDDLDDLEDSDATGAGEGGAQPPAEAAHARRTMIGRSAEEVDHAPPRGRYAPVPAPLTVSTSSPLRWAAPAAALVVASAIVVGRAVRRRR